ncbi:MAG: hypothetical protein QOH79_2161 [Acidimicrobiaceae bacterium]
MTDGRSTDVKRMLKRGTAVQATADVLREEILNQLPDGDGGEWLLGSEDEVLERLGVSRPTLRQAVRLLEAEQLLVVRRGHGGGIWAQAPSSEGVIHSVSVFLRSRGANVLDLMDAVALVAPRCMALAAENPDVDARSQLVELAEELNEAAGSTSGARRFAVLRLEYFNQVAALASNPLINLYFSVANDLIATTRRPMYLQEDERRKAARFYTRAADAIVRGDAGRAERLARTFFTELVEWLTNEATHRDDDWLLIS